jgi:MFS superfamily sulfate permease-like transporter
MSQAARVAPVPDARRAHRVPSNTSETPTVQPAARANRFDRLEWAGAFGDLGTLVPFVVAYVTLLGIDPYGILFTFGVAKIASGLYYRTPFPVQPMKAIGTVATTQAAQTFTITPNAVLGAGLLTGAIWLLLGLTGATRKVAALVSRPVTVGIILGLGFGFMLEGTRMMSANWWQGGIALVATALLLRSRRVPVMFLLLIAGAGVALASDPALVGELRAMRVEFRAPTWALGALSWHDVLLGAVFLALPQVPLTLGNAIIAVTDENNRLFPDRPVSVRGVSVSTGVLNLLAAPLGGVPMCHGAGGMAGHVRFGARTGGAMIVLGAILLALALFLSGSIATLFRIFPTPILGVILFFTGAQLGLGSCDLGKSKEDRFVSLVTAAVAMWNIGLAFVLGVAAYHLLRRNWMRL